MTIYHQVHEQEDHQHSKKDIVVQGHTQYPTKTLDHFQRHQSLDSGAPSVNSRGRGEGLTRPTAGPSRGGETAAAGSERRGGGGAAAAAAAGEVTPKAATGSIQREGAAAASTRTKG